MESLSKPPIPTKPAISIGKRRTTALSTASKQTENIHARSQFLNSHLTSAKNHHNQALNYNNNNNLNIRNSTYWKPTSTFSNRVSSKINGDASKTRYGVENNNNNNYCRCNRDILSTHLNQDILTIKTYLLRLKRTLAENTSTIHRSESVESDSGESSESENNNGETLQDLRRQINFLQEQNEEKDRTIKLLRRQLESTSITKTEGINSNNNNINKKPSKTISTQTIRVRSGMTGSANSLSDHSTTPNGSVSNLIKTAEKKLIRNNHNNLNHNSLYHTQIAKHRILSRGISPHRRVIMSSDDGTLRIPILNSKNAK